MGIDHIFDAVGNNITAGQRIEHTVMTHGNTIVNGNGIELCRIAAQLLNLLTDNLTDLMEVGMTRHKLRERVHNGNNGLAKLFVFHTCGHPERTGSGHSPTLGADCTS